MTLNRLQLGDESVPIPSRQVVEFLRAVDEVIEQHGVNSPTTFRGFVPSNYLAIYRCLRSVYDSPLLCGDRFCEWGSGVGAVASLASMVGYESYGIEYDRHLCKVAEGLREAFGVAVTLIEGSFIPEGVEDLIDEAFVDHHGELSLHTGADRTYDEIGYHVNDFDLVFAYPWPNDVELTLEIFDRCAARGALLLVYFGDETISLYRKH